MKTNNLINYLRHREGLTQKELGRETGLTANDICRMESNNFGAAKSKLVALAEYFKVSCDHLTRNNFEAFFASLTAPPKVSRKLSELHERLHKIKDEIGRKGEEWVYGRECEKLSGTIYANAVNPNYANDEAAGFDLLSFDPDGTFISVEVKATAGNADDAFYLSAAEYRKAAECQESGERFEIHRVHHINHPEKCGRKIILPHELFRDYEITPCEYLVRKRRTN